MIEDLRDEIKLIDEQIVFLLSQRYHIAEQIGVYKKQSDKPLTDAAQEKKVVSRAIVLSTAMGVDSKEIENIFRHIIILCTEPQERIL